MPVPFPAAELAAAEAEEGFQRTVAFLNLPERIGGLDVMPLTLHHVVVLESIGSPFVCGGDPTANDVVNFLWLLNPEFKQNRLAKRWFYLWHCRNLDAVETVNAIVAFIEDAFSDSISGNHKSKQFYSNTAALIDLIASEYGWSKHEILDLPIREVIQYSRAIVKRHNPSAVLFNPSERIVGRWLKQKDSDRDN